MRCSDCLASDSSTDLPMPGVLEQWLSKLLFDSGWKPRLPRKPEAVSIRNPRPRVREDELQDCDRLLQLGASFIRGPDRFLHPSEWKKCSSASASESRAVSRDRQTGRRAENPGTGRRSQVESADGTYCFDFSRAFGEERATKIKSRLRWINGAEADKNRRPRSRRMCLNMLGAKMCSHNLFDLSRAFSHNGGRFFVGI